MGTDDISTHKLENTEIQLFCTDSIEF